MKSVNEYIDIAESVKQPKRDAVTPKDNREQLGVGLRVMENLKKHHETEKKLVEDSKQLRPAFSVMG